MVDVRITPEEALKRCKSENKGTLKIFLGNAPGVGKTYAMLNEANRRFERGDNILVGYFEPHDRPDTIAQLKNLPCAPLKNIKYKSIILNEMNVEEIVKLKPNVVLVDELAHTNVPGSKNKKRYEDVLEILDAGINVYSTINLQHIESLNDIIKQITGIEVTETIPDKIIADSEIVIIDIPPDSLRNRLKRGNIYKSQLVDSALKNFFRVGNLNALRELTLRQLADEVDEDLVEYKNDHDIHENWHTAEKVLVSISSNPNSKRLIRLGSRIAKKFKCPFYVVYVHCTHRFCPEETEDRLKTLDESLELAKSFDANIIKLEGVSVSHELLRFCEKEYITQVIIGHSKRSKLQKILRGSTINKFLDQAKNIQIIVVPYDNLIE